MHNPDVIIIGGGHNALVCACYAAQAGFTAREIIRDRRWRGT